MTSIWWIRRDHRLTDNPALEAAVAHSGSIVPLFIIDSHLKHAPYHRHAEKRLSFMYESLRKLNNQLHRRESRLIVHAGDPLEVLRQVVQATHADAIFAQEDFSPYAQQRDRAVARSLPLHLTMGVTVHHPLAVTKPDGEPYTVFTPFSNTWHKLPPPIRADLLPAPAHLYTPPHKGLDITCMGVFEESLMRASEKEAHRRLENFVQKHLTDYDNSRNLLALDGTSTLSAYLRFGLISARECVVAAREAIAQAADADARSGGNTWITELIWREFYLSILYYFPHVLKQEFNSNLRQIAWSDNETHLRAWKDGLTGYPVVDAAMRQLADTGWMHNRARMIAASFLVKDLLIDWREGERWFAENLIDGDPAANNGGWQWTAGVGTDAAPYFRVFNPVLQSKKFDPEGHYIRRYVPELADVPTKFIHAPWELSLAQQREYRCVIGEHYPAPIVEHAAARQRTLLAYKQRSS